MKRPIQFTLVIIFYLAVHISCTNNVGNESAENIQHERVKPQPAESINDKNSIRFKVNGEQVNSSGWNISRSVMGNTLVLNVTSNMHAEPRTINININGDKPGTYNFLSTGGYNKPGATYGSYFPDYKDDMTNTYHFEDGAFIITSVDTTAGLLNAEFSGTVKNSKDEVVAITNGKVRMGQLKPGITRY